MNQKRCGLFLISFLMITFLTGFVSAADNSASIQQSVGDAINNVVAVFSPIANAVFGTTYTSGSAISGDYLFARVLFFVILLSIVYLALQQFGGMFFNTNSFFLWMISIIVAVLGVRFIVSDAWIQAILLPYQTFGIAITAGLPFVIYFMIVDVGWKDNIPLLRKSAWIFFMVIFIGLYFTRVNSIDPTAIWIYPVTAVLALFMALADGTINRFFERATFEKVRNESKSYQARSIKRELAKLDDDLAKGVVTRAQYIKESKLLHSHLDTLRIPY